MKNADLLKVAKKVAKIENRSFENLVEVALKAFDVDQNLLEAADHNLVESALKSYIRNRSFNSKVEDALKAYIVNRSFNN